MATVEPTTGGAPEKHVICEIEFWLKINGWKYWRVEQQRHMKKGTADIIAGKDGRAIWIEAKRRPGIWVDRCGRKCNIRAGMQRTGQKRFQDYWTGTLPYILAYKWEDVAEKIKEYGL